MSGDRHRPLHEGKIVEHWGESNALGLMQQVGDVEVPGPGRSSLGRPNEPGASIKKQEWIIGRRCAALT